MKGVNHSKKKGGEIMNELKINESIKHIDEVGKAVRKAIKEVGGTMPENLPTPISNIKELENRSKNML